MSASIQRPWREQAEMGAVALGTAVLGGMAAFLYGRATLGSGIAASGALLLVPVIAGAYVRLWTPDLLASFFTAFAGALIGVVFVVLAWFVPLYVFIDGPYRDGGEWGMVLAAVLFLTMYFAGYAAAVLAEIFGS